MMHYVKTGLIAVAALVVVKFIASKLAPGLKDYL